MPISSDPLTNEPLARRRTQSERSEATQRDIIASALRLLEQGGYQEASLQEIARGAGVTLGAVQHHFGSKQVLMERVVDAVMAPLAALGEAWPPEAAQLPLAERAQTFVWRAWRTVYARPSYLAAWSLFFGSKATPLRERIDAHRAQHDPQYFARFVALFPEVAQHQTQPQDVAAVVFAALRGLAVMRLFHVDEAASRAQLEVIVQMIVQAGAASDR